MPKNEFTFTIESNVGKAKSQLKSAKGRIFKKWGLLITSKWTKYIDKAKLVDTGRYKGGVTFTSDYEETIVGNPVEYSSFLENGTSRTKARPTLRPAILDSREDLKKIAEQELKG